MIIKTDGEPAIVVLREAIAKYHGGRSGPEGPAKGESQSNGRAEEAGKIVREFTRVLKEQMEDKAKIELKSDDIIVQWMIRWAAMLVSRYSTGKDEMTPFERRRGRRCRIPMVPFGEKVYYKEIRETKDRVNKFQSEWKEGVWLGHARGSNEVIVGTGQGVVRAFSVKRFPEDERWNKDDIENMQGTPQRPNPAKPGLNIPIKVNFDPPEEADVIPSRPLREETQARRMRITGAMLDQYGYTDNCEGCRLKRAGLEEQRPHTQTCRTRIYEELDKDDIGRDMKKRSDDRISRKMAEGIEKEDI